MAKGNDDNKPKPPRNVPAFSLAPRGTLEVDQAKVAVANQVNADIARKKQEAERKKIKGELAKEFRKVMAPQSKKL